jgi:hypothetical protein
MRKFQSHFPTWKKKYSLEQIVTEMVAAMTKPTAAAASA